MRYISVGKDAQFERLANSIKFLKAERKAVSIAARKYTAAVSVHCKRKKCNYEKNSFNSRSHLFIDI